ncbi:hypothetical protein ACFHW0_18050 [Micromonospora sp. LOL_025]|uniref:hypothetical protein n=1 Tax=Micromonospora sp. LOL_025 TaxID=3345413 RepID=UPI003A880A29
MPEPDLDDLLDRAKYGRVSKGEVEWVAQIIGNPSAHHDLYRLIHIIGRAGNARDHEELVAPFLDSPGDPMLSRIASIVLDEWGLFGKYHDEYLAFCQGVDWDYEEDVRIVALTRAGKYLAQSKSSSLLACLIQTATSSEEDEITRRAALDGLALATGAAIQDLPSVDTSVEFDGSWAAGVLRQADQRYRRECQTNR